MALLPAKLGTPYRPEGEAVERLLSELEGALDWQAVLDSASRWVLRVREHPAPFWALESLLKEFPISSAEGLALMRLSEALLRVPDMDTAAALTADQLSRARFEASATGEHPMLAALSSSLIALSKHLLVDEQARAEGLIARLGMRVVVTAAVRVIQLLGKQFVFGRDMDEALEQAREQRHSQAGALYSFDMLGEGARTEHDARRYLGAYRQAIAAIAQQGRAQHPALADGISIKLSALHARYESTQAERCLRQLLPRVTELVQAACAANMNLTIDAEESERLELSLEVFERLAHRVKAHHPAWEGLGLAVQAYQTRALDTVHWVARLGREQGLRFMVRLVKGAYWDSEIKRAQELGLEGYPVFTHKHHTDTSYLACARAMLHANDVIYPQFATHNAGSIAAIHQMASTAGAAFEMQRLHGMGEPLYREVREHNPNLRLRVYAPVGAHRDLLAYLVRRLLENGANSSFVHQLTDDSVALDRLLRSPLRAEARTGQPLPSAILGAERRNSQGLDLTCAAHTEPLLRVLASSTVPRVEDALPGQVPAGMRALRQAFAQWSVTPVNARADILDTAADLLQARLPQFSALVCMEGRKTLADAVAEVREAIDFCRYYASQARLQLAPLALRGPTGESNELRLRGRGVFVCISPWNFPLAIFAGQVVAALVTGNTVAAKPAEQTPGVAQAFVQLLHEAGLPSNALWLAPGAGDAVGAPLVAHPDCAGVCFTGSTEVARLIHRTLAAKDGPIVPFIAETGGLNAMIVDSTALPEQVVDAVVQSAFRSAGQRCSALRLVCLHAGIADAVIDMLAGAMQQLVLGDPADLATDVGPVIDAPAHASLMAHIARLNRTARLLASTPMDEALRHTHVMPVAFEIERIADLKEEIFGPVLHVVRWQGDAQDVIDEINNLGYGLTLGIQTRIDGRAADLAGRARVGNVYVNRNVIGAVVGVQPFGGEGLSGTGPKAGGPHYLQRFCVEQTLSINTTAAGGNVALFG